MAVLDTTSESDGSTATPGPGSARRWVRLTGGLVVLLLALLVGGSVLFLHSRADDDRETQRQLALETAKRVATALTTVSAEDGRQKVAAMAAEATGQFEQELTGYASELEGMLAQSGVSASGTVSAAGIERMDDGTAIALVTTATTVSNDQVPEGAQRNYRLEVQLQRVGERWLVSNVEFVA